MPDSKALDQLQQKAQAAKISDLPVSDFMSPVVLEVAPDSHIYSVVQALAVKKISGAPVVDSTHKLLGVISEFDLLLQAATKDLADKITYTKDVITVMPTSKLSECLVILYKKKLRLIPVVDKNHKVVGLVSRLDVLHRLITPLHKKK